MKKIKRLLKDHKYCWSIRKDFYIKWHVKCLHKDLPAAYLSFIPTIEYATYPYRYPGTFVFMVRFLHWNIGIGEWCNKEEE